MATMALVGWWLVATAHLGYALWRRFIALSLEGYPQPPPAGGVVMAGSVSSSVRLDYDRGTAEKRYDKGTRLVRWLYRLSFQAPFPYVSSAPALEAAQHRRTIVGLLTRYWFGENLVAPVLAVRPGSDGCYTLVTRLVPGTAPRDMARAKALLRRLTSRFLEAGLPTWQVGHYNPRAVGNLIERDDGSFCIIDLESNLVTPFLPPAALWRAIRNGQYPSFDDIDVPRLRTYLATHEEELGERLGAADHARLLAATEQYAAAQQAWFTSEPRILSRVLRTIIRLLDVPGWVRGLRRTVHEARAEGPRAGEAFARRGVDDWVAEGHLRAAEARTLRASLATPEVAAAVANLGVHLAITVALRFPFGSLTRFAWTFSARVRAEWGRLRHGRPARPARRVHSLPVMAWALLPSVGSGAYLLSTPLRANVALEVVIADRLLRRLPFGLYGRLHLVALTTWLARPRRHRARPRSVRAVLRGAGRRLALWPGAAAVLAPVALANGAVLAIATTWAAFDEDAPAFTEHGLLPTTNVAQLLAAGVIGLLTFRRFWRGAAKRVSAAEAAGIFLWAVSGVGLIAFAMDDYLTVHERTGDWIAAHIGAFPTLTNNFDDLITLAYGLIGLLVIVFFRDEVLAVRRSSSIYAAGVVFAALMLLTDAFAHGPLEPLEAPFHVLAVGLLLSAHIERYVEVRRLERGVKPRHARHGGTASSGAQRRGTADIAGRPGAGRP